MDRAGGDARRQLPVERGRQAGIAGILPVGVPAVAASSAAARPSRLARAPARCARRRVRPRRAACAPARRCATQQAGHDERSQRGEQRVRRSGAGAAQRVRAGAVAEGRHDRGQVVMTAAGRHAARPRSPSGLPDHSPVGAVGRADARMRKSRLAAAIAARDPVPTAGGGADRWRTQTSLGAVRAPPSTRPRRILRARSPARFHRRRRARRDRRQDAAARAACSPRASSKPLPIVAGIFVATLANHAIAGWVGTWVRAVLVPADVLRWLLGGRSSASRRGR